MEEFREKYPLRFEILDKFEPLINEKWKAAAGEALLFVKNQKDENQRRKAELALAVYDAYREAFKWMCDNIFDKPPVTPGKE